MAAAHGRCVICHSRELVERGCGARIVLWISTGMKVISSTPLATIFFVQHMERVMLQRRVLVLAGRLPSEAKLLRREYAGPAATSDDVH